MIRFIFYAVYFFSSKSFILFFIERVYVKSFALFFLLDLLLRKYTKSIVIFEPRTYLLFRLPR